jgi:hypothetical protein
MVSEHKFSPEEIVGDIVSSGTVQWRWRGFENDFSIFWIEREYGRVSFGEPWPENGTVFENDDRIGFFSQRSEYQFVPCTDNVRYRHRSSFSKVSII